MNKRIGNFLDKKDDNNKEYFYPSTLKKMVEDGEIDQANQYCISFIDKVLAFPNDLGSLKNEAVAMIIQAALDCENKDLENSIRCRLNITRVISLVSAIESYREEAIQEYERRGYEQSAYNIRILMFEQSLGEILKYGAVENACRSCENFVSQFALFFRSHSCLLSQEENIPLEKRTLETNGHSLSQRQKRYLLAYLIESVCNLNNDELSERFKQSLEANSIYSWNNGKSVKEIADKLRNEVSQEAGQNIKIIYQVESKKAKGSFRGTIIG